jgi:peptidoglycan/xylan/chitin deacetylase (PgdA/CDA1 family)
MPLLHRLRTACHDATPAIATFYHDIEQNLDSEARPEQCREIVRAFLAIEKRHDVRATYNIAGKLIAEQPDMIDWIARDGHEVAFHSYDHRRDWSARHYCEQIDSCRDLSEAIRGYRSPRSEIDLPAVTHLWDRGFLWNAEGDSRSEPYFIHRGLVRLPITTDDWPLHRGVLSQESFASQFTALLDRRPYVAIGFHDSVTSFNPHERLDLWERLLRLAAQARVPTVTFSEAADLFRRTAVARYYTRTASEWNRDTRSLYRTRRFKELIAAEVDQLHAPVIADLGSGGGVLSAGLAAKSSAIHCIDNAPGMIAAVDASTCIQARVGEATESNLPARSVDFVLCARVVEYLFWPERLADEIARIGKRGATYFVTFPALRGTPAANGDSPPDRIRRYFRAEDVQRWAAAIGPGRLLGIQYRPEEPHDAESERLYRSVEASPTPGTPPTNWVYIGTVERDPTRCAYRPLLPISQAGFRFPGARSERIRAARRGIAGWLPAGVRAWLSERGQAWRNVRSR